MSKNNFQTVKNIALIHTHSKPFHAVSSLKRDQHKDTASSRPKHIVSEKRNLESRWLLETEQVNVLGSHTSAFGLFFSARQTSFTSLPGKSHWQVYVSFVH